MGSQSVTNFSEVRMKRIRSLVKDYSPKSSGAKTQAREIGAAAVGTLGPFSAKITPPATKRKKRGQGAGAAGGVALRPGNEFLQALSSPSVRDALELITSFADELKKARDPKKVYDKYDIGTEIQRPLGKISALLTKAHSDSLSATQAETDSAFAAKDAIAKTMIDVVSRAFPQTPAMDIDREKLAEAIKHTKREEIVTAFMENVVGALIDLV